MALFSTEHFGKVKEVEVLSPDGSLLTRLDLGKFRIIKREKKPEKRAFINQLEIPPGSQNGWYAARITLMNGKQYTASDYVIISELPRATGHVPGNEEEVSEVPESLSWAPVTGASYYQVFIRDVWNDEKLIHSSKLLSEPVLKLPPGLLAKGGLYSWIIHARDTNEHILLGDFNHGSLNKPATFSIRE